MHQQFDKDRLEVLVRAKSSEVQGVLLCADTLDTAEENLKFIKVDGSDSVENVFKSISDNL